MVNADAKRIGQKGIRLTQKTNQIRAKIPRHDASKLKGIIHKELQPTGASMKDSRDMKSGKVIVRRDARN